MTRRLRLVCEHRMTEEESHWLLSLLISTKTHFPEYFIGVFCMNQWLECVMHGVSVVCVNSYYWR